MPSEIILKDGDVVRVGETDFEVSRSKSMLMMIGELEIVDPKTGQKEIFRTPTPGWEANPKKEVK